MSRYSKHKSFENTNETLTYWGKSLFKYIIIFINNQIISMMIEISTWRVTTLGVKLRFYMDKAKLL